MDLRLQKPPICIIIIFDILYNLRELFRAQAGRETEKMNKRICKKRGCANVI